MQLPNSYGAINAARSRGLKRPGPMSNCRSAHAQRLVSEVSILCRQVNVVGIVASWFAHAKVWYLLEGATLRGHLDQSQRWHTQRETGRDALFARPNLPSFRAPA